MQPTSETISHLYISQKQCWKTPRLGLKLQLAVLAHPENFLVAKHCQWSSFYNPLHNGSILIIIRFIQYEAKLCFQVFYDQNNWVSYCPTLLLFLPGITNFGAGFYPGFSTIVIYLDLVYSVILGVHSWKQFNILTLPFLFS